MSHEPQTELRAFFSLVSRANGQMIPITSSDNATLKRAIRLHESRGRRQQGRIIIFGDAEIRRAAHSGIEFVELFVADGDDADTIGMKLQQMDVSAKNVYRLASTLFQKLAFGNRMGNVVAIANRPSTDLARFQSTDCSLVLVIEGVEKPGNIGAVYRSAAAAGIDAVFLADCVGDIYSPNAIRSSLGTVFGMPSYSGTAHDVRSILLDQKFQILAARVDSTVPYFQVDMRAKSAIVLGSESEGLSSAWSQPPVQPILIPMTDTVDSLNVAMSAAIIVYEAKRQRLLTDGDNSCAKGD